MNNLELHQLIIATGWTLLHSVWQIGIYGLIIFLILRFVSKDNTKIRYTVSTLGLLFIFLSSIITFIHYTYKSIPISEASTNISSNLLLHLLNSSGNSDIWSLKSIKIDSYIPLLVNIYIVGVCVLSLQMTISYLRTLKMKKHLAYPVNTKTRIIAEQLIKKFELKNKIIFKESGYVKVPSLIGYFKPVVLLPVSMLSGIPDNQLEIIIAHELAHIKRHDYLLQFIQGILELLFFYHPVVWWLSSVVNAEREHLCDDLAVKVCGESVTLIKALNNMEAIRKKRYELVLSLSGKKDNILNRIQRILRPKTKQSTQLEKYLLSGLFVFLFTGLILVSNFAVSGNLFPGKQFFSNINAKDMLSLQANSPNSKLAILSNRKNEFNDTIVNQSENELDIDINGSADSLISKINVQIKVDEIIEEQIKIISEAQIENKKNKLELEKSLKTVNSQEYREQLENQLKASADSNQVSTNIFIKSKLREKHPLIIVNGEKQAYSYLENIDPNIISSINVIKDKATSLKYGKNSENGVIEIITKTPNSINDKYNFNNSNKVIIVKYETSKDSVDLSQVKIKESINKMPLYIVDGKELSKEALDTINENEIKNVFVYKGKQAKKMYAEDEVIIIESKDDDSREVKSKIWHKAKNKPLFIIDGKKTNLKSMDDIDPETIKSINILKDKSATAIYGKEGENGVILIKSRAEKADLIKIKGKAGKNAPIYILNGKKISEKKLKKIDKHDIESVNVYKGKTAIEKYGEKAKNGVIEITLKK